MIVKTKTICLKNKCSYRKEDDNGKAFCLFPQCPYDYSYEKVIRNRKPTLKEIIEETRMKGLLP